MTEPTNEPANSIEQARPKRTKLWVALALVLVLAAGGGVYWALRPSADEDKTASDKVEGASGPVTGGTFKFGVFMSHSTPDPQAGGGYTDAIIGNNVTDKLTWQDPDSGEITPWLAESWEFNEDITEYTFKLRQDVTFSDGTPFNAEVVKANFDQYVLGDPALDIDPNGAPYFPGYLGTEVVDEFTVKVSFDRPSAGFLQGSSFTANYQPGFLALATLAKSAEERTDPKNVIGTGPFVYEEWIENVRTVVVKRPDYNWAPPALERQGAAYLDKIVFNILPEGSVRTGALRSGEVDAILDVTTTDEGPLAADGFEIVARQASGSTYYLNLFPGAFPTDDINVRRAIQLGWNRESLRKTALSDSYTDGTSAVGDTVNGWVDYSGDGPLRYDPEEAKRLLEESGWEEGPDGIRVKDGQRLEIKHFGVQNVVPVKAALESIQLDLADIGIDFQINVLAGPDFSAAMQKGASEYNALSLNRSRNDIAVLNTLYNPTIDNGAYIDQGFEGHDDLVASLSKLEQTLDPAERTKYAKAAQDLLIEEYALVVALFNPSQVIAQAPYVHDILFDAQARNHFRNTWLETR
ncbi:MAG: ABC transporter substrate-binding protein [Bifidobacteriaceae bacterium]|jgi:peptide/nickel transport system substrate-binding protein|nr:ABC transporter substrate-binding protein [Bifidobacteriaceae bacterium]